MEFIISPRHRHHQNHTHRHHCNHHHSGHQRHLKHQNERQIVGYLRHGLIRIDQAVDRLASNLERMAYGCMCAHHYFLILLEMLLSLCLQWNPLGQTEAANVSVRQSPFASCLLSLKQRKSGSTFHFMESQLSHGIVSSLSQELADKIWFPTVSMDSNLEELSKQPM